MRYLDELGQRVRQDTETGTPTMRWLKARRQQRRQRRRWLVIGTGCLLLIGVAVGIGLATTGRSDDSARTEAIATTPDESAPDDAEGGEGGEPTDPPTVTTTPRAEPTTSRAPTTTLPLDCGPWPSAVELWPGRDPQPPADTIDDEGRRIRRQSIDGATLEVLWPPSPRVDYDLEYVVPDDIGFEATQGDPVTSLGFTAVGQFATVSSDDPTLGPLEGRCAQFEFRLFQGDELVGQVGLGFASLGRQEEVSTPSGQTFTIDAGFDWIELGPIVAEQKTVTSVPGSVRCDGVLVDLDTATYQVDGPVRRELTLSEAIEAGHLIEVIDPTSESTTAGADEYWAVVLPGAPTDVPLGELNGTGALNLIDARSYEDFVDPETGPTFGPGIDGRHPEPIDALKAFFDHPAAETFITSGLVELTVDDGTVAYGVPQGHGENGWITVITTEADDAGNWSVTGWTSAGC